MTDYAELKHMASASLGEWYVIGELRYEDRRSGDLHGLHHEDEEFIAAANPAAVLALIAENEALCSKLTTVNFVCDQLPGPDGCRFIELENPQGESLGDEFGEWEIRPDGLAQLVVEIASPDVKRMAALLECAQGDLKQAMQIIEKDSKDAERYRFLKNLPDDDCLIERLECNTDPENWDSVIDAAMSKEGM